MKTLLIAILTLAALSAGAQSVTNITVKITVEIAGVGTNSSSIKLQQDGTAKESRLVDGNVWYYNYAKSNGLTTNTFDGWLKDEAKTRLQLHADEKAVNDNQITAQKVSTILTTQPDLLSAAQKNQLATIAALLP